METIRVALIGNPNVGKSVIFNNLTGMRQHVGNWPGKTVEKKIGSCTPAGTDGKPLCQLEITDLPGTYSFTAQAVDELIARRFIVEEKPDVVVDIVDATNLERNLYLTMLLIELGSNVVVVLNMWDLAQKRGIEIDVESLSEGLGVPVVPTIATTKVGMDKLIQAIIAANQKGSHSNQITYSKDLENKISRIIQVIQKDANLVAQYRPRWLAIKLLESDTEILKAISSSPQATEIMEVVK
ncbi:MAG: FeoB small GTPase domain-containing protein [Promethearchaeota archaeon]